MQKFIVRLLCSSTVATTLAIGLLSGALLSGASSPIMAALPATHKTPALTISNDPLPPELQNQLGLPSAKPQNAGMNDATDSDSDGGKTVVGYKVDELQSELSALQGRVSQTSSRLAGLDATTKQQTANYQANVAEIRTKLQAGTTPGNPRLVKKLALARRNLEIVSGSVASLNALSMDIASEKSTGKYLLQSVQAALKLSGAVDEDHVHLNKVKDSVSAALNGIDQMSGNINSDTTRMTEYVSGEHDNLRALALGVQAGNLSGKLPSNNMCEVPATLTDNSTVDNNPVNNADMSPTPLTPVTKNSMPEMGAAKESIKQNGLPGPRPLAKIRFDHPNVAYEQPVSQAVQQALSRYPNARFQLVAVHPAGGNPAEVAIESTRARRDAEKVLRSLTQMGVALNRIDLSSMSSAEATTDEVRLYVR